MKTTIGRSEETLVRSGFRGTQILPPEMLAPKEVAQRLNVHVSAVYRAVERGELPAVRLNSRGAIRIPRSALEAQR